MHFTSQHLIINHMYCHLISNKAVQKKKIFSKIIKIVKNAFTLQLRVYKSKSKGRLDSLTSRNAALLYKTIQHLTITVYYRQQHQ